jgi:NAD(P) transhydrogenase
MQFVDLEVSGALRSSMEEREINFVMGSKLSEVRINGPQVAVLLEDGKLLEGDVLFFAAGRTPNSDRLGLEKLGIKTTDRGEIIVNADFQTSIPSIYAAGDVLGLPALAATAQEQGRHAACHMFGNRVKAFPTVYPIGIYTIPELSSVGKTEQELKTAEIDFVVGRANYSEVARGYIRGDAHGLLKLLVCTKTHKILGIHIVGHDACNLIHIGLAFMQKKGHVQDLLEMIFNYPTLAEAYRIAAFNALNKLFKSGEIGDPPAEEYSFELCQTANVK